MSFIANFQNPKADIEKSKEFQTTFNLPSNELLYNDYSCACKKKNIMLHGRMYVSQHFICFKSNILGYETQHVIPFRDITAITKKSTALFVPNAIEVSARDQKYFFSSFFLRDQTHKQLTTIWRRLVCDDAPEDSFNSFNSDASGSIHRSPSFSALSTGSGDILDSVTSLVIDDNNTGSNPKSDQSNPNSINHLPDSTESQSSLLPSQITNLSNTSLASSDLSSETKFKQISPRSSHSVLSSNKSKYGREEVHIERLSHGPLYLPMCENFKSPLDYPNRAPQLKEKLLSTTIGAAPMFWLSSCFVDHEFFNSFHKSDDHQDYERVTDWKIEDSGSQTSSAQIFPTGDIIPNQQLLMRIKRYDVPVEALMGPSSTKITETQRIRCVSPKKVVLESCIYMSGIPFEGKFHLETRWTCTSIGTPYSLFSNSNLTVDCEIVFDARVWGMSSIIHRESLFRSKHSHQIEVEFMIKYFNNLKSIINQLPQLSSVYPGSTGIEEPIASSSGTSQIPTDAREITLTAEEGMINYLSAPKKPISDREREFVKRLLATLPRPNGQPASMSNLSLTPQDIEFLVEKIQQDPNFEIPDLPEGADAATEHLYSLGLNTGSSEASFRSLVEKAKIRNETGLDAEGARKDPFPDSPGLVTDLSLTISTIIQNPKSCLFVLLQMLVGFVVLFLVYFIFSSSSISNVQPISPIVSIDPMITDFGDPSLFIISHDDIASLNSTESFSSILELLKNLSQDVHNHHKTIQEISGYFQSQILSLENQIETQNRELSHLKSTLMHIEYDSDICISWYCFLLKIPLWVYGSIGFIVSLVLVLRSNQKTI